MFSKACISSVLTVFMVLGLIGSVSGATVDGVRGCGGSGNPWCSPFTSADGSTIDIVGDTSSSSSGTGRAKGNSYQVDISVILEEMEFWLNFTSTQTLTFYVFVCPDEFGTYTEVYRESESVTGSGAGWYSSGSLSVPLDAGYHYIIAVSWDGTLTYYYGVGEIQPVSFGYHTHGYASGYDPLPASFESTNNDQAIYHQRLTTAAVALQRSTWGSIKSSYPD